MSHRLSACCMGSVGTLARRCKSEFKINLRFYSTDGSNVCVCVGVCGIKKVSHRTTVFMVMDAIFQYIVLFGGKIFDKSIKKQFAADLTSKQTDTNLSSNV